MIQKGYIREPEGMNFVVENNGLSDAERVLINQIIEQSKAKRKRKKLPNAVTMPKKKKLAKISL